MLVLGRLVLKRVLVHAKDSQKVVIEMAYNLTVSFFLFYRAIRTSFSRREDSYCTVVINFFLYFISFCILYLQQMYCRYQEQHDPHRTAR